METIFNCQQSVNIVGSMSLVQVGMRPPAQQGPRNCQINCQTQTTLCWQEGPDRIPPKKQKGKSKPKREGLDDGKKDGSG